MDYLVPALAVFALTASVSALLLARALHICKRERTQAAAAGAAHAMRLIEQHREEVHALKNELMGVRLDLDAERYEYAKLRDELVELQCSVHLPPRTPLPPPPPPAPPVPPPLPPAAGIPVTEVLQIMAAMAADRQSGYEVMARVITSVTAAATAPFTAPPVGPPGPAATLPPPGTPQPWYAGPQDLEAFADPLDRMIPPIEPRQTAVFADESDPSDTGIAGFAWQVP